MPNDPSHRIWAAAGSRRDSVFALRAGPGLFKLTTLDFLSFRLLPGEIQDLGRKIYCCRSDEMKTRTKTPVFRKTMSGDLGRNLDVTVTLAVAEKTNKNKVCEVASTGGEIHL